VTEFLRTRPAGQGAPRRARLTAGVAGLSLVAGAVGGLVATTGSSTAAAAGVPAAVGAPAAVGVPAAVGGAAGAATGERSVSSPVGSPAVSMPAGAAGAAPRAVSTSATATGGSARWAVPDASVTTPASEVVGAVPADRPVRLVTVRSVDGRPSVTSRTVTGRASATAAVAKAQADDATVSVGVDRVLRITDTLSRDTLRTSQWALTTLRAERAWSVTTGTAVTVAVIDTGVQAGHPDLAGTVVAGVDLIGDKASSTDGSNDENGHGTHVAGIIGAIANNSTGVAGLAPGVKILPVRVLDGDGAGYDSDIADGIVRAVDRGAKVLNLSMGGTDSGAISTAVKYAIGKNVVVVAAAGNEREDGNPVSYPAADEGVIGVGATDSSNTDAPFSNTGSYVDLAAPGVGVWSTYKGGTYRQQSGTSMASPHVAAAAALTLAVAPGLSPAAVTRVLEETATDLGAAGRDDATGYGLVDPYAALCSLVTCGTAPTPAPTTPTVAKATTFALTTGEGSPITAGARVTLRGTLTDTATGARLAGVAAQVCVRTAPATAYRCTAATTAADGTVGWTATPTASTWVYLTHAATPTTTSSRTATAAYPLAARVGLRAGSKSVTATVAPPRGQVVKLDRWTGKAWALVTGKKVTTAGAATFTKLTAGTYRVRVTATSSTVASTSGSLRVR